MDEPAPPPPRYDNRYSRIVAWLKVILPLAALALLSTMFLVPGPDGRNGSSGIGASDLRDIVQKRLLSDPTYSTVTEDGGALTVTAATATPRLTNPDQFDATELSMTLDRADGGRTTMTAETGLIDRGTRTGTFVGAVRVATEQGYALQSERIEALFDGSFVTSPVPVLVTGPGLRIEAGAMDATTEEDGPPAGLVLFKQGVRLIYDPQEAGQAPQPE